MMPRPPKIRPVSKGFTLMELLVVIAIIAVIAGIAFPAFNYARRKSRATQCVSNMKQIGLALQMYAQDWSGYAPPYTTIEQDYTIIENSDPPVIFEYGDLNNPALLKAAFAPYTGGVNEIWFCPLDPDRGNPDSINVVPVDHSQTSYIVDERLTIWAPVPVDNPPVISPSELSRLIWDQNLINSAIYWVKGEELFLPTPRFMSCVAGKGEHGRLYPVVKLDGSVAFAVYNKGFTPEDLTEN